MQIASMSSRSSSSSSVSVYTLTELQLKQLCYDIFNELNPDGKTYSSSADVKLFNLKVIYMNKENSQVGSVLAPTAKQLKEALEKLVNENYVIAATKHGVKHYMRNIKSGDFENPYNDGDEDDAEDGDDNDDINDINNDDDDDDDEDDNGDEDKDGVDHNSSTEGNVSDTAVTDDNHVSRSEGHVDVVESTEVETANGKKRKQRAPTDVNATKKVKKKDNNPLKRKINPDLLKALASSGVFIMEGVVVLKAAALDAAEKIEKGLWHTTMRPRAQGSQQTITGAFQKQPTKATKVIYNIEDGDEHFDVG